MGLRANLLPSSTDMMSIRQDNGSEKAPATLNNHRHVTESTSKLGEEKPNFLASSLLNSKYLNYTAHVM